MRLFASPIGIWSAVLVGIAATAVFGQSFVVFTGTAAYLSLPADLVRFALDSPLEGGVTCELVSVSKFPVSRENTGNFIDSELSGASTRAKKAINSMPYEPIPYASEQGIF